MNRIKGFVFPILIILGLVIVPRVLLGILPVEMKLVVSTTDILDLGGILNALLFFGVALALLSAIKNLTEKWSTTNLAANIASISMWFILSLYMWGAGDPWGFGVVSRTSNIMKGVEASFVLDLRFFVILLAGISLLNALNVTLVFARARGQRHVEQEAQPPPSQALTSGS